jgi:hypothetical protein
MPKVNPTITEEPDNRLSRADSNLRITPQMFFTVKKPNSDIPRGLDNGFKKLKENEK